MEIENMGYMDKLISPLNGESLMIASKVEQNMVKPIMDDELWI